LIKLSLQNSVIRSFECVDRLRAKRIECFVHRNWFFHRYCFSLRCEIRCWISLRIVNVFCFVRIMITSLLLYDVINTKCLFILFES
jgi:hypothetical protein